MASASINPLNDHGRKDRFATPIVLPGERYVWEAPYIILLKDKAQAATNAVAEVFPDSEIHEVMCATHASIIWFSKNTCKFWNPHGNRPLCIADINYRYKVLGHIGCTSHRVSPLPFQRVTLVAGPVLMESSTRRQCCASKNP